MRLKKNAITTVSLLLAISSNAFGGDILLSYTPMNKIDYVAQTNNIGLEIGHYKNRDKQGFGFGWRLAVTKPTDQAWFDGGTGEVGVAPGYTIIEDLDVKVEAGVGLHSYNSVDVAFGGYVGGEVTYAAWGHMVLGVAVRQWFMNAQVKTVEDVNGNDLQYSYNDLRTTAYLGYRF